jgi:hypothetical protein
MQVIAIRAILIADGPVGLGDKMKRPADTPGLYRGCRIAHGNSLSEKTFDRMYKTNKIITHLVNPVNHVDPDNHHRGRRRHGERQNNLRALRVLHSRNIY